MKYLLCVVVGIGLIIFLTLTSKSYATLSNFVTVSGDNFSLNAQKFYFYGTNYFPSYYNTPTFQITASGNISQSFLSSPYYENHLALLEKELQDLQDLGYNVISIQAPYIDIPNGVVNLKNFFTRLKVHNLRATIYLNACDPLLTGQFSRRVYSLDECLAYVNNFDLINNETLVAYEIAWEPSWGNYETRKNSTLLQAAWKAWIIERYWSEANAQAHWGITDTSLPTDVELTTNGPGIKKSLAYRRFVSDYVAKHYGEVVKAIKQIDPNHLISARTGYTEGYITLSFLQGASKVLDFIGLEGWSLPYPDDTDTNLFSGNGFAIEYAKTISSSKPVIFYEFGEDTLSDACHAQDKTFDLSCYRDNPVEKMNSQAIYYQNLLNMAIRSGAAGVMNWFYVGKRPYKSFTSGDSEISDYGIREVPQDDAGNTLGMIKPAYTIVKQYQSLFTHNRTTPIYQETIRLEVDDFPNESDFWRQGATMFAAALQRSQLSTYTSHATGTDSVNSPRLCVGNTAANNACPSKYLNALFNQVEILNGSGNWQKVTNGSKVTVKPNSPIQARASIKNTGEAIWLSSPTNQFGTVRFGGNENVGSLLFRTVLPANVQPNMDVWIENMELSPGITTEKKVVMQMENIGVIWFGEQLAFTLKPTTHNQVPDLDNDQDVDWLDFLSLKVRFGSAWVNGDFNSSGLVDVFDFSSLINNFGKMVTGI